MDELIPDNHPLRTVSAIIDRLDISETESTYKGGGTRRFHPRMLLKVVVYSYMCSVYSGRRMECLLHENVNYMWLSGMSRPDFRTINRFRSERLCDGRFEDLSRQTVVMMNEEGLVSLKVQYIDGTKIEFVANKYIFVWKGSVEKNKAELEVKVDAMNNVHQAWIQVQIATENQFITNYGILLEIHVLGYDDTVSGLLHSGIDTGEAER